MSRQCTIKCNLTAQIDNYKQKETFQAVFNKIQKIVDFQKFQDGFCILQQESKGHF